MERIKYVVTVEGRHWYVQRGAETTKAGPFTRDAAVWNAVARASEDDFYDGRNSQVLIKGKDGKLRVEQTYGDDSGDRFPID